MKFRTLFLIVIILALPMLLAACGGDKVGNAEKFLKAVGEGDADEAEKYICDDEKDSLDEMEAAFGGASGVTISDISCEEDGDNVKCDYKIAAEGVDAVETSIVFTMDGDKVCGSPAD